MALVDPQPRCRTCSAYYSTTVPQVGECRAHPAFVARQDYEWCADHRQAHSNDCCKTCAAFREHPESSAEGKCHAHPMPIWKRADDWCREWAEKIKTPKQPASGA